MGLQSGGRPNFENFEIPDLGVLGKMTFGCSWLITNNNIGGRWWLPPSLNRGEFCESMYACGLLMHQKCSNYALTNLLFSLYRSIWIIDLLATRFNPYLGALECPSYPKVLWVGKCTLTFFFTIFILKYAFGSFKGFGVCHYTIS